MDKLGLPLAAAALSWSHANNTLVVSYAKPAQVMQAVRKRAVFFGGGWGSMWPKGGVRVEGRDRGSPGLLSDVWAPLPTWSSSRFE